MKNPSIIFLFFFYFLLLLKNLSCDFACDLSFEFMLIIYPVKKKKKKTMLLITRLPNNQHTKAV